MLFLGWLISMLSDIIHGESNGNFRQAVFVGWQKEIVLFEHGKNDEMEKIILWDMKEDIGYVDECDVKIVQIVSIV